MTKQELATKIWETANALRKNIKASEYKDYIIGFMFYKYLSDKETDFVRTEGGTEEDLKDTSPENIQYFQDKLGYFISYDDLFDTWKGLGLKLGAQTVSKAIESFYGNLNERYARCFYVYNKEVDKHSGVFDALDTGLSKLGENAGSRDKAVRDIVGLVSQIPPKSRDYDVIGYVYEYLIKQFSSEAKKDGAFYTPAPLTSLMARIIADRLKDRKELKIYDPCVGTAGLLLNIGKEAGRYIDPADIKYYGQELITETSNLAKMNLFMQDIPVQNIIVRNANTLEEDWPYFDEFTEYSPLFVDAVTVNPPYSAHWDPDQYKTDERYRNYGLAPATKADMAFLLHCLYHVKPDGIMAIVLPHGVLFRGGAEQEIRKNLIENHNIETIIGFPAGMFFATGIPVIVMVLSKNRKEDDIYFVDASQSYAKEKTQNVLRESDIQRIFDAVKSRKNIPDYARLVSKQEIIENDYNLNIPRYVSASKEEQPYDLFSVTTGEISDSELDAYREVWDRFPGLRQKIFSASEDDGYSVFDCDDIRKAVYEDDDVRSFEKIWQDNTKTFGSWLDGILIGAETNADTYHQIKDKLFESFSSDPLVDKYDIYQAFAEKWDGIDADLSRIREEGWGICSEIEDNIVTKKNSKTKQYEDSVEGKKGKVIPLEMIREAFFTDEEKAIQDIQAKMDEAVSTYTDILDSFDEDMKAAVTKDDDETNSKFDDKKIKAAIKAGEYDPDIMKQLKDMQKARDTEKDCRKQIKAMEQKLSDETEEKAQNLSESEVHNMLIRKWIKPVVDGINGVMDSVLTKFIGDMEALHKKYQYPLAGLSKQEHEAAEQVKESMSHLVGSDADMKALRMLMEDI